MEEKLPLKHFRRNYYLYDFDSGNVKVFSEGIPSYVEGEHMNNIYGGISGTMTTVVAIKLYILCNDYEKALEIIKDAQIADLSGIAIHPKAESLVQCGLRGHHRKTVTFWGSVHSDMNP